MNQAEKDSISRALDHHELTTHLIEFCSAPYVGRPKWRIKLRGQDEPLDLTWREAKILCLALATGERHVLPGGPP